MIVDDVVKAVNAGKDAHFSDREDGTRKTSDGPPSNTAG